MFHQTRTTQTPTFPKSTPHRKSNKSRRVLIGAVQLWPIVGPRLSVSLYPTLLYPSPERVNRWVNKTNYGIVKKSKNQKKIKTLKEGSKGKELSRSVERNCVVQSDLPHSFCLCEQNYRWSEESAKQVHPCRLKQRNVNQVRIHFNGHGQWLRMSPGFRNHCSKRIEPPDDQLSLAYKDWKSDEINWNVGRFKNKNKK